MIGYISDDHTWVSMELRRGGERPEEIKRRISNGERQGAADEEEEGKRKMKEGYLNVWSKMEQIEEYLKPAQFYNLKKISKIQAIVDIEIVEMNKGCFLFVLH